MTDIKRKIVRNTIANYTFRLIVIVINLLLLPFIVDKIGVIAYGIYALVGAITGYFGLLDMGISPALVKHVAEDYANKDINKLNETVNAGFFFFLAMGIISFVSFIIIGMFFIQYFNMPYEYESTAKILMYITAIATLFGFPLRSFTGILIGLQKHHLTSGIGIISSIINAVVIVIILSMGGDLIEMVFYSILFSLINPLLTIFFINKILPELTIHWRCVKKKTTQKIFRYGSVMFIISICGILIYQTDRIIIGAFLTVGGITFYVIASKLHTLIRQVHGLMSSAIMPAASELDTLKKRSTLKKLLIRGSKYTCAVVLPITIMILLLTEPIIRYWMGDEFLSVTILRKTTSIVLLTQIFVFYWLLNANTGIASNILMGIGKLKLIVWYTVCITIANLALSIILVMDYGLIGVVLGTTIPYIIGFPIFIKRSLKIIKVRKKTYFKQVILKTYPLGCLVAAMLYFLMTLHYPSNLIEVGIFGVLTLSVYLLIFYVTGLNRKEKEMVKRQIQKFRNVT